MICIEYEAVVNAIGRRFWMLSPMPTGMFLAFWLNATLWHVQMNPRRSRRRPENTQRAVTKAEEAHRRETKGAQLRECSGNHDDS